MKYLLALDQGTSSSRAIVFADSGKIVAMAQREFRQIFPNPGWVEHSPQEIWSSQLEVAREALHKAELKANQIAAIGITNQRETTVVWHRKTGEPLYNAIVWQDRRGEPACADLRARGFENMIRERTGLVIDPYFSASKLRWILDNVRGARELAERGELAFGTVDSWLMWKLTGGRVHATDVSNAARTMLFDIRRNQWSDELLAALDIPLRYCPKCIRPATSLPKPIPIFSAVQSPLAVLRATSSRRFSARPASVRGWRKILTAPVVLC